MKKIFFILVILLFFVIGYFYFFVMNPSIEKPIIEKPTILNDKNDEKEITEKNIQESIIYALNEIGVYKLHNIPLTENKPIILVVVIDEKENKKEYYFSVENNEIRLNKQDNEYNTDINPDIKITILKSVLFDFKKENMPELIKSGKIKIEPLKDESTLALKGYMGIYTELTKNNQITGEIIKDSPLYPKNYNNALALLFLASFIFLIGLIIERYQ